MQQDRRDTSWLQSSFAEKFLGVPADNNSNVSQQSILKVGRILGCTSKIVASRLREGILARCLELVRPCLKDCALFWVPMYKMDIDMLE